jgi:aromatic-L-amino-acid/L-tryptophan decarboxylase
LLDSSSAKTSASEAALVTVVAAKSRYMRRNLDVRHEDLVLYTTTQTHSLGAKAGLILGVKVRALDVSANDAYSLRGGSLKHAIEEDKSSGKHPFALSK